MNLKIDSIFHIKMILFRTEDHYKGRGKLQSISKFASCTVSYLLKMFFYDLTLLYVVLVGLTSEANSHAHKQTLPEQTLL